jgi:FkbM family methyltransferase
VELFTCTTPYGTFSYWPNDGIGKSIATGAFWDEHLRPGFDAVPEGSVVVDAGANLGWFTIYAAKRGCHVYSFEPCLELFELLKLNVEQNGVAERVSMFPVALYDCCVRLEVVRAELSNPAHQRFTGERLETSVCENSGGFALRPNAEVFRSQYGVPLDFFDLRDVALIKTDAEGADLEILQGAEKTIRTCQPILCYEYLGPNPEIDPVRFNRLGAFIEGLDYDAQEVLMDIEGQHHDFIAKPKPRSKA